MGEKEDLSIILRHSKNLKLKVLRPIIRGRMQKYDENISQKIDMVFLQLQPKLRVKAIRGKYFFSHKNNYMPHL